ncbi:MAG: cytochrome c family protein [Alphaproteobacteria bacterium]
MRNIKALMMVLLASMAFSGTAFAEGDPAKGKRVYVKCKACHEVDQEKNKVGPHLVDVIGRPVASVDGYNYSKGDGSMTAFAEGGKVWDEETLAAYLRKPKDLVKRTKMAFPGLRKDEDIADLIAYLKSEQ